jgi:tetratricopeptide (TPR) repeat protein
VTRQRNQSLIAILVVLALITGCHVDPNVRKARYLESGKRFDAQGKFREAAIQFLNSLKVDKNYPEAHYELAHAYEHLGRSAEATSELTRTVELQPSNYKAQVELGNLLFANGKTGQAQVMANAVMAKQPNNPGVHALLSAIAAREGKNDLALAEIHKALALDPSQAVFHEDLALLLESDPARSVSVEDELDRAIELDPKSLNARILLAGFYSRNDRLKDAEMISWQAVATNTNSIAARENLAQVILSEGDQARAEQVLRQASKDLARDSQGVRLLADYYTSSGQWDKAVAEFSRLKIKYPESMSLQVGYVHALLQDKDYSAAQSAVADILKSSPKDPDIAELNGLVLIESGKADDAVKFLLDTAKTFPDSSAVRYWLGNAALAAGNRALAEKSFLQATDLNPAERGAQEQLAQIACQRGDVALLADVADDAIEAMPSFFAGYVWRANVEMDRNLPEKAEADLRTAMDLAPQSSKPYLDLGKLRFAQKRFPEGVDFLEQALQNDPNAVEALRLLIDYDLSRKQPNKAQARVKAQIEKSPANSRLYDLLAKLQLQSRNLDQAEAAVQKAIQMNPADGDAVMLFAQIAAERGSLGRAIATWEQQSNAHPGDAGALAILGTLEESRGDSGKAQSYYKRSLQIQPQQPVAANNLAYRMLLNGEEMTKALALAQTARQGMPDSTNTADTLAWAYYCNGSYEFARNLLVNAINTESNSAIMHYHLGMVYSGLSDKRNAEVHLKRAASLAPDSPIAKDAKAALHHIG